ncbi:DNA repair endonuclease xpf [Anaeramoeba flamelloides]|uniref:DNA repair endonuclease xpf n=1 Tax=Anaeramoeba flamelloides TaxID=1746091 RepID=A0ABQ8YM93_9EUKA|nr:DNA repair endonuclease xpf [Anaeramoeba flamelloides]
MLSFQKNIFNSLLETDGMLVCGKGLGLSTIQLTFLKMYCNSRSLVFVLNYNEDIVKNLIQDLFLSGTKHLPKLITNDFEASVRVKYYHEGGVLFITSRILVHDILKYRVPLSKLSGLFVFNAHSVETTTNLALILELVREQNQKCFIRCMTNSARALVMKGTKKTEALLRSLLIKHLFLLPRFHLRVQESLDSVSASVFTIPIEQTRSVKKIQELLFRVIELILQELREMHKINKSDLNFETILFSNIRFLIESLSSRESIEQIFTRKTLQLLTDIRKLKQLCWDLINLDCISFFIEIKKAFSIIKHNGSLHHNRHYHNNNNTANIKQGNNPNNNKVINKWKQNYRNQFNGYQIGDVPYWINCKQSDQIYILSRNRVFQPKTPQKLNKIKKNNFQEKQKIRIEERRKILEPEIKWVILQKKIQQILPTLKSKKIIVFAKNDHVCSQLKEIISTGPKKYLEQKYCNWCNQPTIPIKKPIQKKTIQLNKKINLKRNKSNTKKGQKKQTTITMWLENSKRRKKTNNNNNKNNFQKNKKTINIGNKNNNNNIHNKKNINTIKKKKSNTIKKEKFNTTKISNSNKIKKEKFNTIKKKNSNTTKKKNINLIKKEKYNTIKKENPNTTKKENLNTTKKENLNKNKGGDKNKHIIKEEEEQNEQCDNNMENEIDLNYFKVFSNEKPKIIFHPLVGYSRILKEFQPECIFVYNLDLKLIRRLEVFLLQNPTNNPKIYILQYENETIDQKYFQFINNKEINAFDQLIKLNEKMVVYKNQEKKIKMPEWLKRQEEEEEDEEENEKFKQISNLQGNNQNNDNDNNQELIIKKPKSTRQGGGFLISSNQENNESERSQSFHSKPIILIDTREFMGSSIPFMIHKKRMKLIPIQLKVGDFVLSDHICVERKTIPDLISSFKDGRLFRQITAMKKNYTLTILLIEFNKKRGFRFIRSDWIKLQKQEKPFKSFDEFLIIRLATLLTHFQKLKILWCRNAKIAAETFKLLKTNNDEPNIEKDKKIQKFSFLDNINVQVKNKSPWEVLRKMPGITQSNILKIANNIKNLSYLARYKLDSLTDLIGKVNGTKLYNFLHNIK